jgi:hypothetical protein
MELKIGKKKDAESVPGTALNREVPKMARVG